MAVEGFRIGGVAVEPGTVLAPMAGITDRHFRVLLRRLGGVGLVSMEFLPAKAVHALAGDLVDRAHFSPEERPISVQIYGSDAQTMAEAARWVQARGADLCDINMGCPANKILKGCAGAALMRDPAHAAEIVRACRKVLDIPLTVKFRLGTGRGPENFLEVGRICQEEGADAVTLHPRTARQMYSGKARWTAIADLVDALSIPVIGNGDVRSAEDALRLLRETGCAGVMVGRAAIHDPWIFSSIAQGESGEEREGRRLERFESLVLTHFSWILRDFEPVQALHKMRTFTGWYSRSIPRGQDLRRSLSGHTDPELLLEAVGAHFRSLRGDE